MKRLSKKVVNTGKGLALITVSAMGIVTLAACSINYSELAEGLGDLGRSMDRSINGSESVAPTTASMETEPTSETEDTAPSETPTPTPTPKPTATPIPTPTPMQERVDFSDLTTDTISEGVDIQVEEFEESFHPDGEELELVTFKGNRMVVSIPENKNVQTAVNLILDGVYEEAEGLYTRYSNEAESEYILDPDMYMSAPYSVKVNYSYSFNGRLISVVTDMAVEKGIEEVTSEVQKNEIFTFDVITGQYVTNAMVAKDVKAFESALAEALALVATNEDNEYDKNDVSDPIVVVHEQGAGSVLAQVYGTINGRMYHAPIDLTNYTDYLNSYGKIVYKINR